MQQIQFCREGLHNYMTIACEEIPNRTSYEVVVLELEQISGLMQYEIRVLDGMPFVYYRLHYRTALKQVFGEIHLDIEKVCHMLESIVNVLCQMENYLLNQEFILWRTDTTFVELNSGKLLFCYYPMVKQEHATLKDFWVELLQFIDKRDEPAYMLGMEFYNMITNADCSLEKMSKWIEDKKKGLAQELCKEWAGKNTSNENKIEKSSIEEKQYEKSLRVLNDKKSKKVVLQNVILAVVNMVVLVLLLFDIWTYQYVWVLIVTLVLLAVSLLASNSFGKDKEVDNIMEEYMEQEKKRDSDVLLPIYVESCDEEKKVSLETTVLTMVKDEIVMEDKPQELYLKSLTPKKFLDIFIDKKSIVIGSMKTSCDYILSEKGISRMHAKIIKKEDGLYVLDMNSTNQTYLNEQALTGGTEYLLNEGDVVSIAGVVNYVVVSKEIS